MRIIAKEVNNSKKMIDFDWLPLEIKDSGGDMSFASYSLLDRGEVVRPKGKGLRRISWEARFPGESRKDLSVLAAPWTDPLECDKLLKRWQSRGTLIELIIEGTGITGFKCYVNQYSSAYTGGLGDLEYSIEWIAYEPVTITKKPKPKKSKNSKKRPSKSFTKYTVKSGDTLWGIAGRKLGNSYRWKEIYKLNKKAIEDDAKKHKYSSSDNGNRIWPGLVLKLPKK
ncbi:LysM peptidoglycan-binding domain-containing protein [Senimuribacter intestinalis]|uniref:LysM peptidoglycan-binding domain-containing protein n=1 Tax=Senimuribacter intestinalis TaxID=2941507 RepID=UPI00203E93DA|nr:LysM peptidoglycan-binding domain-containing protein [Senimuribacter intestinalis]